MGGSPLYFIANHTRAVNKSRIVWETFWRGMQNIKGGLAGHDAPGQLGLLR